MRNLPHYKLHPFKFHKIISDARYNPAKTVLSLLEPQIKTEIDNFIYHDINGSLHLLPSMALTADQKKHLLGNYSYAKTKDLRESVMMRGRDTTDPICPYCTINEYQTMDHFLPKEDYPAHSVNSNNLIPCCHICNAYKGTLVKENGNRLFLNLYSDILPEQQYLFVNFNFRAGSIPDMFFFCKI